jgi:EAL domain-containing protein (putative c-di-GMP-specific phosphodiesterase class I)
MIAGRRVLILTQASELALRLAATLTTAGIAVRAATDIADFIEAMERWQPTHVVVGVDRPNGASGRASLIVVPSDEVDSALQAALGSDPRPQGELLEGGSLEELDDALDLGRLSVAYHPKIDTRTGTPFAVEALARWHRPGESSVPPEGFVRLAELSGRIGRLSDTIFEQSTTWFGRHLAARGIALCLNVSALSLSDPELPGRLAERARRTGIDPAQLVLEITESSMTDHDIALSVVTELRERGMRVALDDFGTGYASLLQLARYPFTDLKIDGGLVTAAATSAEARSVVGATVRLGADLGLRVVAEGVADEAAYNCMQALGCPLMQGDYLAPPMGPGSLLRWFAART